MSLIINCKSKNSAYWKRDRITDSYFYDIRKFPELSQNKQKELLYKVKSKDKNESLRAMHKLVECNQRFVLSMARKYSTHDNFNDIIGAANEGLIHAINKFDIVNNNNHLITYAVSWMRKYINEYLINDYRPIKPINANKVYTYANKVRNKFYNEYGRMPSTDELQNILLDDYGIKISNQDDLEILTVTSIDKPVDDDNDSDTLEEVGDFANATSNNNVYDDIYKKDNEKLVDLLLSKLNDRERELIRRFYGIKCESESLDKISKRFSLTRERVRQIISDTLKKMKENSNKFKNI